MVNAVGVSRMPLSVVSTVADQRPAQTGVETDAHAFDGLLGTAALELLQELLGDSLALAGPIAQVEIKVEPASDRVKLSVEGASGVPAAKPHAVRS